MKFLYVFLSVFLFGFGQKSIAQPFDTLLLEFKSIRAIYPLADSTFILVGVKESAVRVSRINSKTETIWYQDLVINTGHGYRDHEIHLQPSDSTIQIYTLHNFCGEYLADSSFIITLDLNGIILDTVRVLNGQFPTAVFLLSGSDNLPRCASVEGNTLRLHYRTGETEVLNFSSLPFRVGMCPRGKLIVALKDGTYVVVKFDQGHFTKIDTVSAEISTSLTFDLVCGKDDLVYIVNKKKVIVHDSAGIPFNSFEMHSSNFASSLDGKWIDPYFYSTTFYTSGQDSFYVMDQYLDPVYSEWKNDDGPILTNLVMNKTTTFKSGAEKVSLNDAGHLQSEDLETKVGPKYYDIEFVTFELPPADSSTIVYGMYPSDEDYYVAYFSEISITIRNSSDFVVSDIVVDYRKLGYCDYYFHWQRKVRDLSLQPGETRTISISDIELATPLIGPTEQCISVIRPDNHADDYIIDNKLCRENIMISTNDSEENRVRLFPNPTSGELNFYPVTQVDFEVRILDINGAFIASHQINSAIHHKVNVESLVPGIYLLQYVFPGGKQGVDRFVKL